MLKIIIHEGLKPARIRIEGKLKGVWVKELEEAFPPSLESGHREADASARRRSPLRTVGHQYFSMYSITISVPSWWET